MRTIKLKNLPIEREKEQHERKNERRNHRGILVKVIINARNIIVRTGVKGQNFEST